MKYTEEQKKRLKIRNKEKFRVQFNIENRIKNNYPIAVKVECGYYIIESKMNTL